jgi:glutamate formiminotransferase/glutamate formiminotransferase/formiminotetrahydrofolate cyclodeaminase
VLLAVPNVSEGRDTAVLDAIGAAFARGARVLDRHEDADHNRAVFTLAGEPGRLAHALVEGAREAVARIDIAQHRGEHPRVGAIDVAPIVHLDAATRGAACAEAIVLADALGHELELPVYLYGLLAGGRTRAELRRGGPQALIRRAAPDYGPHRLHPTAGAVLVAARPPLVAFNVELAPPATLEDARAIAGLIRESGPEGLPGVRALGIQLAHAAQVSTNIEDHQLTSPAQVVAAVARHARVQAAELVALAPKAAFDDFPPHVPLRNLALIEERLNYPR